MSFDVDITKRRGDVTVTCRFEAGPGVTVLFGPSGAGKTSVLDMIAGLLRPDAGRIVVGGRVLFDGAIDLPPEQRRAGYVFQDARLFPHMRVRDNLTYGGPSPSPSGEGRSRVAAEGRGLSVDGTASSAPTPTPPLKGKGFESLDFLGITDLLDRWPRTLSGGEARRVAIGRALLSDPAFLLLDEPLASLDRARREEVMAALEHLRDHAGLPILLVTHDRAEAERLGTRVVAIA